MLELNISLPRDHFHLKIDTRLELDGIWGIMGPSGCGKTSLLRCLAGLEKAEGRICFNDTVWMDSEAGVMIPPEKRELGYIFQEARLFPHLTVMGNLNFAIKRASRKALDFDDVVEQVGIRHLLERPVQKLSGGEKQRVAIARTLLNAPKVLLMDEPLASLDWESKLAILPCLKEVHRHFNIPVIIVSHAREEMARLADNLMLLHQGRVVEQGLCQRLISSSIGDSQIPLSVLDTHVLQHDQNYPLTELKVDGYHLTVNRIDKPVGSEVRVVLPAHEVSIVLDDVQSTSVQNRLPVVVDTMTAQGDHHMLVTMALGEQSLMAQITRKSADSLGLAPGMRVFAHFKASGLEVV